MLSSLLDGIGQLSQNALGVLPADTCVGDGDCVFEARFSFLGHLLVAFVDVRFDHDTHDGFFTGGNLGGELVGDLGLVLVVLLGVTVAGLHVSVSVLIHVRSSEDVPAVNHESGLGVANLLKLLLGLLNVLGVVVGSLLPSSENDEAVVVTSSADNGDIARLGDRQEVVGVLDSADGVNGNIQSAVGTVLEADREGQTRGQFTVNLRLCCACANGTERQEIGSVLRSDGIQHLTGNGHALLGQVEVQLSRNAKTSVDVEAVIKIGVVDQALPADSGTRLLEVGAHDDDQLILVLLLQDGQSVAVFESGLGVVQRTGTNDDKQSVSLILALDNIRSFVAALEDSVF